MNWVNLAIAKQFAKNLEHNRPIEPQTKAVLYTKAELKHFQKCKKSICDQCTKTLSKIEVNAK